MNQGLAGLEEKKTGVTSEAEAAHQPPGAVGDALATPLDSALAAAGAATYTGAGEGGRGSEKEDDRR
jgi:hypothetical protein